MDQPLLNSIYLSEVTSEEINNKLKYLKNGAAGYDELNACLLKHISPFIIELLKYLNNLSLCEAVFPSELKLANVIPLSKSDDVFLFNNYRPVSLPCVISKVFEKVMYKRLIDFIETFAILNNSHFGFRKMHSTYMALMTLMNRLISFLENNEYILGIFFRFFKGLWYCRSCDIAKKSWHTVGLGVLLWNGLKVISATGNNMWHTMACLCLNKGSSVVSHRDLYLVLCYFLFILMIYVWYVNMLAQYSLPMTLICFQVENILKV